MKAYITPILQQALTTIGAPAGAEFSLETPRQADHGDLATNAAMGLARQLQRPPRQIAEQIIEHLNINPAYISGIEIAGPGFINFRFTPAFFRMRLAEMAAHGSNYGKTTMGNGIKTNVEYVSANPTGPLHPGHGRNSAIGDTLANILRWTGHDVTREYYFNNAGKQMRNLAISIHTRYLQLQGHDVPFPEDGYHGEYINDIAQKILTEHGDAFLEPTDETINAFREYGERWNFRTIRATLDALHIEHDLYYNEDSLYKEGLIQETIDKLTALGNTYEKDGALWLKLEDRGLDDRVIVKSTGEPTYRLPDIAYHVEKFKRGFDLIIDVFGADHVAAVPDVKAAVEMLGYDVSKIHIVMNQMVTFVENGQPVKLSKRSGKSITLDELLEELGADVVRFFFIMRGVNTQLEFDLGLAREQSEKNPVYYLQYAHARIAGVLRHAETEGVRINPDAPLDPLERDEELALIKLILQFPETLERTARELEPQGVAEYLREVAAAFHKFYHEHRIIGAETDALRDARMRLLAAAKTVLANGLKVLGITPPERM